MLQIKQISSFSQNQLVMKMISFKKQYPKELYEIESLNNEVKSIFIEEGHFTEIYYPFIIKPNFSTLEYIMEVSSQGPIFSFMFDDSIRDLL